MPRAIVLPVNILVIVVIATVASLGLVGVYGVGSNPFTSTMGLESVKNNACRQLVMTGCKTNTSNIPVRYDANANGLNDTGTNINWNTGAGDDNLAVLCYKYYGRRDDNICKKLCGCPEGAVSSSDTSTTSDFSVSISPTSATIAEGSSATPTVTVSGSSASPVGLGCGVIVGGGTCSFTQNNLRPRFTSTLTLSSFPVGTYTFTITGSNTSIVHTAPYTLKVIAAGSCTSCGSWTNGACGAGGCLATERPQTRTGSPVGCTQCPDSQGLSRCFADSSCSGTTCTSCSAWTNSGSCGTSGCSSNERPQTRTGSPSGCTRCSDGQGFSRCNPDLSCVSCSCGTTSCGQCVSGNPPRYCDNSGNLVDNCGSCGCLTGQTCNPDGTCSYSGTCTCNWNDQYKCGGGGCTVYVFSPGWWSRCECNPSGCGLATGTKCSVRCDAVSCKDTEYEMICTSNMC